MKREIEIIINKSEITAGTRGASLGPEAVMTAARKKGSLLFGNYVIREIENENDMLDREIRFPYAKRIEGLVKVFSRLSMEVQSTLMNNKFPLVLAADHGSAGGTIAGIKAANATKRLGVIWIDAHGDLHTPQTTPSGNMHGMPLATALGEDNLPCAKNNISDYERDLWNQLKNTGVEGVKVKPEDLVFVAVRDTEPEEEALMDRLNIKNHTVEEVRKNGTEATIDAIKNQLVHCDIVYVSFDVDSMDPTVTSHGTGTPVDNGLLPVEAEYFLTELAQWDKTVCIEFVEVNPCLDEKVNKMAEVTFDLVEKVINTLEENNGK